MHLSPQPRTSKETGSHTTTHTQCAHTTHTRTCIHTTYTYPHVDMHTHNTAQKCTNIHTLNHKHTCMHAHIHTHTILTYTSHTHKNSYFHTKKTYFPLFKRMQCFRENYSETRCSLDIKESKLPHGVGLSSTGQNSVSTGGPREAVSGMMGCFP